MVGVAVVSQAGFQPTCNMCCNRVVELNKYYQCPAECQCLLQCVVSATMADGVSNECASVRRECTISVPMSSGERRVRQHPMVLSTFSRYRWTVKSPATSSMPSTVSLPLSMYVLTASLGTLGTVFLTRARSLRSLRPKTLQPATAQ
jgi:hypothetical protein